MSGCWFKIGSLEVFKHLVVFTISACLLVSCGPRRIESHEESDRINRGDALIEINRTRTMILADRVRELADRSGWNLSQTGSGLFYEILENNPQNLELRNDMVIAAKMTTRILYPSDYQYDPIIQDTMIRLGSTPLISGLNEGLQLMHVADSARFILLPHLGYGLTGEGKIPPGAVLLIELRVSDAFKVNDKN